MASAALTEGWQWWGIGDGDKCRASTAPMQTMTVTSNDATDCLNAIMEMTVRDPGGAGKDSSSRRSTKDAEHR